MNKQPCKRRNRPSYNDGHNSALYSTIETLEDRTLLSTVFETFDARPTGSNLLDNSNWVGRFGSNTSATIDDQIYFGPRGKSVHIVDNNFQGGAPSGMFLRYNFQPITQGVIQLDYYMRSNNESHEGAFVPLRGPAGNDIIVSFGNASGGARTTGYIGILKDTGWIENRFLEYDVGKWYHVRRTLDVESRLGDIYVAEVDEFGEDIPAKSNIMFGVGSSNANISINHISIGTSGSQGADVHIDNIFVGDVNEQPTIPPNPPKPLEPPNPPRQFPIFSQQTPPPTLPEGYYLGQISYFHQLKKNSFMTLPRTYPSKQLEQRVFDTEIESSRSQVTSDDLFKAINEGMGDVLDSLYDLSPLPKLFGDDLESDYKLIDLVWSEFGKKLIGIPNGLKDIGEELWDLGSLLYGRSYEGQENENQMKESNDQAKDKSENHAKGNENKVKQSEGQTKQNPK